MVQPFNYIASFALNGATSVSLADVSDSALLLQPALILLLMFFCFYMRVNLAAVYHKKKTQSQTCDFT